MAAAAGVNGVSGAQAAVGPDAWTATGGRAAGARLRETATLLETGKVLVAGGADATGVAEAEPLPPAAQLYDPASGTWAETGAMTFGRSNHTATRLGNGRVLAAGGRSTAETELYDNGVWARTGDLNQSRKNHTATLLGAPQCTDCKVLVVGGFDPVGAQDVGGALLKSAELYDPATGSWTETGSANRARGNHRAVLLNSGKVLVVGGAEEYDVSAEIYDPATGKWTTTGSLSVARSLFSMTVLDGGAVLLSGGFGPGSAVRRSAELYDPATGTWRAAASMAQERADHAATLLPDGRVMVTGGAKSASGALGSAEVYHPDIPCAGACQGSWAPAPSLITPRRVHHATLLATGKVLVAGGQTGLAELYGPRTLASPAPPEATAIVPGEGPSYGGTPVTISGTNLTGTGAVYFGGRAAPSFTVNSDGTALTTVTPPQPPGVVPIAVATPGGVWKDSTGTFTYLPTPGGVWSSAAFLDTPRQSHSATLLPDGRVLVVSIYSVFFRDESLRPVVEEGETYAAAEVFDPTAIDPDRGSVGRWSPTGPMVVASRDGHAAVVLRNGTVLVSGGHSGSGNTPHDSAELYDPKTNQWRPAAPMTVPRKDHTATLLPDGKVLVVGDGAFPVELYDPDADRWTPATSGPSSARTRHTATLLMDGKVLIAGSGSSQMYIPANGGSWSSPTAMKASRQSHTASLLPDGDVLVVGGDDGSPSGVIDTAERYHAGSWVVAGGSTAPRSRHTAAVLANGKVLIAGGYNGSEATASTDLFDPAADNGRGSFSPAGPMTMARSAFSATSLPSGPLSQCARNCGKVIVVGGKGGGADVLNSAEMFTPTPEVTAVAPVSGPTRGGTVVTITGTGLASATDVGFDGVAATSITHDAGTPDTKLTAVTPRHGSGPVDVSVFTSPNPDSLLVSASGTAARFTYVLSTPGVIEDLAATPLSESEVELSFSAPRAPGAADSDLRGAAAYVVKQSLSSIDGIAAFDAAPALCGGTCSFSPPPEFEGEPVSLRVDGLISGTTYHYSVRAVGAGGELGPISNVASATTSGVAPSSPATTTQNLGTGTGTGSTGGDTSALARPVGQGYWLVGSDGGVFAFGGAAFAGSTGAIRLNRPIVGMAATPTGRGYWLVGEDGGVFAFGDAVFAGSTGAMKLNRPIVGMAATPTGRGYWLVAADGGLFAFGDAVFAGSAGSIRLNRPIVGMAASPTGRGYWLVGSDGGVFAFGDTRFLGSTGAIRLNRPIVGMAASTSGRGYRLVAEDGGVFAFGDARFLGSTGALRLNRPIVGMAGSADGLGYRLVASDGGIFAFGTAGFSGSLGGTPLNAPVVGMAAGP